MTSALTGDATSFATVEDDTPTDEARYRASFMINADNVASMSATTGVFVFTVAPSSGLAPVQLSIVGDGAGHVFLNYAVVNGSGVSVDAKQLAPGPNHVEFDFDNGTSAGSPGPHFSLWINSNTEGTPTATLPIVTTAVVETAFLGLAGPTQDFTAAGGFNGTTVAFDTFDSRRSSFIGF